MKENIKDRALELLALLQPLISNSFAVWQDSENVRKIQEAANALAKCCQSEELQDD